MKKVLIVCMVLALTMGVLSGCSRSEQPIQEQASVAVQQPLVDHIAQVTDDAQKLADQARAQAEVNAKLAADEAAQAVKTSQDQVTDTTVATEGVKADAGAVLDNVKSSVAEQAGVVTKAVPVVTEPVAGTEVVGGAAQAVVSEPIVAETAPVASNVDEVKTVATDMAEGGAEAVTEPVAADSVNAVAAQ